MSMRRLRVALCQIESHPAVYSGHLAHTEEPFVPPPNGPSLSRLSAKGIDVQALQEHCGMEYAAWLERRLGVCAAEETRHYMSMLSAAHTHYAVVTMTQDRSTAQTPSFHHQFP